MSLADARDQDALFEIARTLDVLVDLDVRAGDLRRGRGSARSSAPSSSTGSASGSDPDAESALPTTELRISRQQQDLERNVAVAVPRA